MTNDELRAKLWEAEAELARLRWTLEQVLTERRESQMVVSAIMPFVPEIREKMMGSTLQQYKEQLERIVKRINELPVRLKVEASA
jgi:hypothetical protein